MRTKTNDDYETFILIVIMIITLYICTSFIITTFGCDRSWWWWLCNDTNQLNNGRGSIARITAEVVVAWLELTNEYNNGNGVDDDYDE